MLSAIFCYIFDEERFSQNQRNLTGETYHKRFCKDLNEYESLEMVSKKFKFDLKEWDMVAVIRDPLERFASGFADKCLREKVWKSYPRRCNRCRTVSQPLHCSFLGSKYNFRFSMKNLTCFMERQYSRMMHWTTNIEAHRSPDFDDDHFFPQSWRCEFHSHFHDYKILHLDTSRPSAFIDSLLSIFKKNNVSDKAIHYIKSSVVSGRNRHSTVDTLERKQTKEALLSNAYLIDLLIKMYYYDFILFGYPIPAIQHN
ncbi:unnamed protein product [Strongylus vulgaris]|uniref:Sulfotransferase domain-containing protein n=1 Tax=Strongylus vulgaris TaxID=40348 RepID=A0A3P7JX72_STRVU|nr:unnamed protein product [Strongylus vulgaris]